MSKSISEVIKDRIEDGFDAIEHRLIVAKSSRFLRVRSAAEQADRTAAELKEDLNDVDRVREECLDEERQAKNGPDYSGVKQVLITEVYEEVVQEPPSTAIAPVDADSAKIAEQVPAKKRGK